MNIHIQTTHNNTNHQHINQEMQNNQPNKTNNIQAAKHNITNQTTGGYKHMLTDLSHSYRERGGRAAVNGHYKLARTRRLHPVSITRFPLSRFSPGAGLLRNPFFTLSTLRFSRGWVRKDGNPLRETGCTSLQ